MVRKRKAENLGLPTRWVFKDNAYYYMPKKELRHLWDGKSWFRLGANMPDAYKAFGDRIKLIDGPAKLVTTIGQLLDRYEIEEVPKKAPKSQTENRRYIRNLRAVFGGMILADLEPQHVYQYVDKRTAKVAAHREIEVLSHAFTKAVQWGVIKAHPFKGEVRLEGEASRDRYVEDWELIEAMSLPPVKRKGSVRMIKAYLRIKMMTGMRKGDLLHLKPAEHFRDDGIHVTPRKTRKSSGKSQIYPWTDDLRSACDEAIAARPALSHHLFCNRKGEPLYDDALGTTKGFDGIWQNFMDRVLGETKVTERFTEHDLRAKVGSDAESLERARQLLAHADLRTTDRAYRRRAEVVLPAKSAI